MGNEDSKMKLAKLAKPTEERRKDHDNGQHV
jgi:hypothetical protein